MNKVDFDYYNKNQNKLNDYQDKSNLEKNVKQISSSSQYYFNNAISFLDGLNPFQSNIEGFDTSNCPDNVESMIEIIKEVKNSDKSLQEQKNILTNYLNTCSKGYNGIDSLLNIKIDDVLKNEIMRIDLLLKIQIDFDNLDNCLTILFCYITPYLATGIHPLESLKDKGIKIKNGQFSNVFNSATKSFNFIKSNYSNLFGETPTEFITGIDYLLNKFIRYTFNKHVRYITENQPIIVKNNKNALLALNIMNLKQSHNNVLTDGNYKFNSIEFITDKTSIFRNKLSDLLNRVNNIDKTGGMNIGGKDFTKYILYLSDDYETNPDRQNLFLKFPSGLSAYQYLENDQTFNSGNKNNGLIHHMAAWSYALEIYSLQVSFIQTIESHMKNLKKKSKKISVNTPAAMTFYIKEYLKQLDNYIDEAYKDDRIINSSYLTAQQLKDKISFRELLENSCYASNYQECCYYLKTLNDATGQYYANCQSLESINNEISNASYDNGLLEYNNVTLGLSQFYIYSMNTLLLYINYYLCKMLRDSYCTTALSQSLIAEADSKNTSVRDIIDKQSNYAVASSSRPDNSSLATPSFTSEPFISSREGFEGNSKLIIGETKFTDTVSNIIKNFTFNLDGKEQTLENYTKDQLNMSSCVPANTPYFSANYKCGTQVNNNPISSALLSDNVSFNCADPENEANDLYKCNTFYLELDDNGNLTIKQGDNVFWSKKLDIDEFDKQFIVVGQMNQSTHSPPNMLLSGESLANGDFLSSPNKTFNLVNENGNLVIKYKHTPCLRNTDDNTVYGYHTNNDASKKSIGMYYLDDVNIQHIGKSGHVNLNGQLQLYDNPEYTNSYLNVGNYSTSQHTNNVMNKPTTDDQILTSPEGASIMFNTGSASECASKCNKIPECGGYVISGNSCMIKNGSMFPVGLRKSDENSRMYVRMKGIPDDNLDTSCSKITNKNNMTNKLFEQYESSGNLLNGFRDPKSKCDMIEASKPYYDEYMRTKQILDAAKKELNNSLNVLNEKDIDNLKQYNVNVDTMQKNIQYQDDLQKNTYKKIDNINTTETAYEDIHDYMNQNLQSMFIYSALTVGFLGITFAMM